MEIVRNFRGNDNDMSAKVASVFYFFNKHLADFTAYDPQFDAAYASAFKTAHTNLGVYGLVKGQEEAVIADELLTEEADKTLKKCQAKYRDAKYFAGKAFPANKEALKEFGEGAYSKVRTNRLLMVPFMETLFGVATKYKTELIAVNFTQQAIDEIATLAAELRDDNNSQQLKKKERPTETRKRIQALNTFYGFGQQVAEAARAVYRNNAVYRNEFLLMQKHHPKITKAWLTLSVNKPRKIILPKLLKKYSVTLTNQGKETIEYWKADNINDAPVHKNTLTAGEVMAVTTEYPAKKFLVMLNGAQKPTRLMLTKTKL